VSGTLWLLPVALGDTPWENCLPLPRGAACRLRHFVAENAKSARAELKRIGHPLPLRELAIEQMPETPRERTSSACWQPLVAGHDLGLMSEAGCPAVADPGALLVRRAHELGITVKPLVGPSSLLLALMGSGLEGQRFAFHGYLPAREPGARPLHRGTRGRIGPQPANPDIHRDPLPQQRPVQRPADRLPAEDARLPGDRPEPPRRKHCHAPRRPNGSAARCQTWTSAPPFFCCWRLR
jgi:hypothetical protein